MKAKFSANVQFTSLSWFSPSSMRLSVP
jgi:hypothetical protein